MAGGAKPGRKGHKFERILCQQLSLWISDGADDELLWRSSISGGRATRRADKHGAQKVSGDICAIAPGGHALTDYWHVEAKHVKDMELPSFFLNRTGFLAREWVRACRQAEKHRKLPMLIVKQNLLPPVVLRMVGYPLKLPHMQVSECEVVSLASMLAEPYIIPRLKLNT